MNICTYTPIKQAFDIAGINNRFITIYKAVCYLNNNSLPKPYGPDGDVLTIVSGSPSWQPASGGTPSLTATQIAFGDGSNLMTSSSRLIFNESGQVFAVRNTGGSQILNADFGGSEYWIGDKSNDANGNHLYLNDAANFGYYDNTAHTGLFGINTSTPSVALDVVGNMQVTDGNNRFLVVNKNLSIYSLGDIDGIADGAYFEIDGGISHLNAGYLNITGSLSVNTNAAPTVALDVVGDVQSADGNVNLGKQTGVYTSLIHTEGGNVVSLGDWNGEVNNTYLSVDDPNSKIVLTNNIQFSSYGAGAIVADGSGNLTSTSDRRAKHNIKPFTMGTRELMKLQSSTFIYNKDSTNTVMPGFIAQDVEKAFGGVGIGHDKAGMLSLNTNVVLAALVNGFKEQQKEIEALKKQNADLVKKLAKNPKKVILKY